MRIKKKILLVDDSHLILQMEKSFLSSFNYEFLEANTGKDALEILSSEKPDLLLLDLNLPDMTGDRICSFVRNDEFLKNISIIMVTVSGQDEHREICYKAGCNDYITKPVNPNELKYKVEKLLNIAQRLTFRILVKLSLDKGNGSQFIFGNSVNISESGLMFETQTNLEIGDLVNIEFFITSPMVNVKAKGKIVRKDTQGLRKSIGYGIVFTEISEESKNNIRKMIGRKSGN